jgi:tyrosyl-tRNA synthetase
MSFQEFSYQTLQAYDWVHLLKKYGCRFQVGGHDQMGNLVTGRDLISRSVPDTPVYALTVPLITSEVGDKFGKSGGNAVWLDAQLTSPYELYQFFLRLPDKQVSDF